MKSTKVRNIYIIYALTYLADAVEHDGQKQVGAVGLLGSLGLILEEGELALDAVPNGHLVDVVKKDKEIVDQDEVLHAIDRR